MLEGQGFIAEARCVEVRVPFSDEDRRAYAAAPSRQQFRLASENPAKLGILRELVEQHAGERILVIGQYLDQLRAIAADLDAPLLTGRTPNAERERLYGAFRDGAIELLVLSKVGNFAVDRPDAAVAIQVSGTFGSRQEEAQRLGRVLRPKADGSGATFYSVVTLGSRDQDFSEKRQLFLTEQGYSYDIVHAEGVADSSAADPGAVAGGPQERASLPEGDSK